MQTGKDCNGKRDGWSCDSTIVSHLIDFKSSWSSPLFDSLSISPQDSCVIRRMTHWTHWFSFQAGQSMTVRYFQQEATTNNIHLASGFLCWVSHFQLNRTTESIALFLSLCLRLHALITTTLAISDNLYWTMSSRKMAHYYSQRWKRNCVALASWGMDTGQSWARSYLRDLNSECSSEMSGLCIGLHTQQLLIFAYTCAMIGSHSHSV